MYVSLFKGSHVHKKNEVFKVFFGRKGGFGPKSRERDATKTNESS